ncbi:PACE efflux transporter [Aeromonas veronii]|uniref:PACE efflux transporter n=1 Tax=Aeromonas veronii TaxID=654 RepID=UPI003D1F714F
MSSTQLRTTPDRLRYLVLYEGIGLALVAPLISQLFAQSVAEVGSLAIFFSIVATAWTYGWNLLFDKGLLKLCGCTNKRPLDRFLHAFGYEASFMMLSLPCVMFWLDLGVWDALMLDLGFVAFYLVYIMVFTWAYERIWPLPSNPQTA